MINPFISLYVLSHDVADKNASTRESQYSESPTRSILFAAAINSSAVDAISTSFISPYGLTTSRIGVEITGFPAARYSGVFVGLIKRVDSFSANGINAMSQPAR